MVRLRVRRRLDRGGIISRRLAEEPSITLSPWEVNSTVAIFGKIPSCYNSRGTPGRLNSWVGLILLAATGSLSRDCTSLPELPSTDLSVLRETFDQIYVLTLDRSKDRHAHIKRALQGIDYRFFSGVDKLLFESGELTLDAVYDDVAHRSRKQTHRSMNEAEVACALSHRAIYEDAIAQGYARILVLEDDVMLCPEYLGTFRAAMAELPGNWELLMLGYSAERYPGFMSELKRLSYSLYRRLGLFNWQNVSKAFLARFVMRRYSENLWQPGKLVGGHAYGLTLAGCQKLVDLQTPVVLQADRVFSYLAAEDQLQAFALNDKLFRLAEVARHSSIKLGG